MRSLSIRGLNTVFSRLRTKTASILVCCSNLWKDSIAWQDSCLWVEGDETLWVNGDVWNNESIWPTE